MAVEAARPSLLASLPVGRGPPPLKVSRKWPPSGCGFSASMSIRRSASDMCSLPRPVTECANHLDFLIHTAQAREWNVSADGERFAHGHYRNKPRRPVSGGVEFLRAGFRS